MVGIEARRERGIFKKKYSLPTRILRQVLMCVELPQKGKPVTAGLHFLQPQGSVSPSLLNRLPSHSIRTEHPLISPSLPLVRRENSVMCTIYQLQNSLMKQSHKSYKIQRA